MLPVAGSRYWNRELVPPSGWSHLRLNRGNAQAWRPTLRPDFQPTRGH
jgi:hypothetical protein